VPWLLWPALLLGLVMAGLLAWHLAALIAGYRARLQAPSWYFPAAAAALILAGQLGFIEARRSDRRWWRLKRAPQLPIPQARVGDTAWLRGRLHSDSPLVAPYTSCECAYFRYQLQERDEDDLAWRTTEHASECVDFVVVETDSPRPESVYVPSGGVLFDAPLYAETSLDPGRMQVRVWALGVGLPVSVCGQLAGETGQPRMDALSDELPVVATWRSPKDYVALVARRARLAQISAWTLTILGALVLIASAARTY
jgi:hypothetical protein